jgi:hypothetical protein
MTGKSMQHLRSSLSALLPGSRRAEGLILLAAIIPLLLCLPSGCDLFQTEVLFNFSDVGFTMKLPDSWRGYRVDSSTWEGLKNEPGSGDVVVESGPMITICHPDATPENPRQNIPIMVMTILQWEAMMAQEWHIGAAPVAPIELGRNSEYVFALPARYNYAFLPGWEEVEEIIRNQSVIVSEPHLP